MSVCSSPLQYYRPYLVKWLKARRMRQAPFIPFSMLHPEYSCGGHPRRGPPCVDSDKFTVERKQRWVRHYQKLSLRIHTDLLVP